VRPSLPVPAAGEPVSDAELIEAWRGGDERAAGELVRRHAEPLARFLSAAGARDELEDLVQETFYRAFRRLESFRGSASFRTWVLTIGSNALKDVWRHRKGRKVVSLEGREVPAGPSDPHGEAAARDLADRLGRSVRQLPPMQRDVFLLRAQQGLEYDEIAAALDTSPGAARVHYHHAVRRLKKLLE
jgi:RNA polymerase sigma-70 factor (ECF subfamily)